MMGRSACIFVSWEPSIGNHHVVPTGSGQEARVPQAAFFYIFSALQKFSNLYLLGLDGRSGRLSHLRPLLSQFNAGVGNLGHHNM